MRLAPPTWMAWCPIRVRDIGRRPPGTAYDAISPGTAGITLWKGFQRDYAEGLELLQRAPSAPGHP